MDEIIVAIFAFCGTLVGTFGGIIASAKLTNFRLEKLEATVEKHNKFGQRIPVLEEKITSINDRVTELESEVRS